MKASNLLIEKIKTFEGFSAKPCKAYKTEKYLTIGYGHYGPDVKPHMTITPDAATELLRRDLVSAERYVTKLNVCRNQFEFDALCDFCYNLGSAQLASSTLLKKVRARASEAEIRTEFAKWVHCGKKVLPGLIKRRQWEADWFFKKQ